VPTLMSDDDFTLEVSLQIQNSPASTLAHRGTPFSYRGRP
jgi:hypothetical protein